MNKKIEMPANEKVKLARLMERPNADEYIEHIFEDFMLFHGDRCFGDDKSIMGGIAFLDNEPVTVIGQVKGKTIEENRVRNFGMTYPEGYRKALRLMKQAEKFGRPIVCFVDTPGAYCGVDAEERGQGEAIAKNLIEMLNLKVPIVSIVIGEGGSGGALALSLGDKVYMLEHAVYSVISPEGFASILWKDRSRADEAADLMKITAQDLHRFKIIEEIIEEPNGGAHEAREEVFQSTKKLISKTLKELKQYSTEELLEARELKYRSIGSLYE